MTVCPAGHTSESTDFCDECGLRLGDPAPAVSVPASGPVRPGDGEPCAVCAEPLAGTFCENCGHDRTRPPPAAGWTATVWADAAWFDEVCRTGRADARALTFPRDRPDRRVELTGAVVAIGRGSGGHAPDIDVADATGDPAVSARHGELRSRPDGSWEVVDLESTNGTRLGSRDIRPHVPEPLTSGDRIRLGAWTTITVRGGAGPDNPPA